MDYFQNIFAHKPQIIVGTKTVNTVRKISEGAFAYVYEAVSQDGSKYALKQITEAQSEQITK